MAYEVFKSLQFKKSLGSDNHSGVHPKIMEALLAVNHGHAHSYGGDEVSELAEMEFKRLFGPELEIFYVFNGTAANVLSLKTFLKSYESALVSDVAHLNVDECAAPEQIGGIKLITLPSQNGKILLSSLKALTLRRGDQHYAQARILSLTQPTELGTLYSLNELRELVAWAKNEKIFLHIDGARLANACFRLNLSPRELTFDLGIDIVSLGGTKNGLMGAEAILFRNKELALDFKFYRKQSMQLPSKTRYLAAQFYAYLKDDLWFSIAEHSCRMADFLASEAQKISEIQICYPVQSNAVFAILPKSWLKPLREKSFFYVWDAETHTVRWMTSFDSKPEDILDFVGSIKSLL